jgi:trimeric autotransporter adhesin
MNTILMRGSLILFGLLFLLQANAQNVGIGTNTPDASAKLEIQSTTSGLLVPRMTKTQRDLISSPASGLMIYQTDNALGFYYYNGSAWVIVGDDIDWVISGSDVSHINGVVNTKEIVNSDTITTYNLSGTYGSFVEEVWFPGISPDDTVLYISSNSPEPVVFIHQKSLGGQGTAALIVKSDDGNSIEVYHNFITGNAIYTHGGDVYVDSANLKLSIGNVLVNGYVDLDSSYIANAGAGTIRWDNTDFLGYDGSTWKSLTASGSSGWGITGNTGTSNGTHFIGTTDAQNLDFRTNNVVRARITQKGQIEVLNTGNSVFIGEGAGALDDLSGNDNVFIGHLAGDSNTTGFNNIAIGNQSFFRNSSSNDNVSIGFRTLYSNKTGSNNQSFGSYALYSNTNGSQNSAIGDYALYSNTIGSRNIAIGYQSLYKNTSGFENSAIGYSSLYSNINGMNNVGVGHSSLLSNTTGSSNVGIGYTSLYSNETGDYNTAIGKSALYSNKGSNNAALGNDALYSNTSGEGNVGLGNNALYSDTSGSNNSSVGYYSLFGNKSGNKNVAIGYFSLFASRIGSFNTALGSESLYQCSKGNRNVAIGFQSLFKDSLGNNNIAIGTYSADNLTTGSNNIVIGYNIDAPSATGNNLMSIGNLIFATSVDGIGTTLSTGNVGVGTNSPVEKLTVQTATSNYGLIHTDGTISIGTFVGGTQTDGYFGTKSNHDLHLFTNDGGPRLTVGTNGSIGINNTAPSASYKLDVQGDVRLSPASSSADFLISNTGVEPTFLPSSDNYGYIGNSTSRIYQGYFNFLTVNNFTNLSDQRIKENINPLTGALGKVLQLKGITYDFKKGFVFGEGIYSVEKERELETGRKNKIGFIAQDVEKILPELVKTDESSDLKSVDYIGVIPILVESVKELNQKVETLEDRIAKLEALLQEKN